MWQSKTRVTLSLRQQFHTEDVSASCWCCAEELQELQESEKDQNIEPDWEVDTLLKSAAREGKRENIITDLMIKLLGLDVNICCNCFAPSTELDALSL